MMNVCTLCATCKQDKVCEQNLRDGTFIADMMEDCYKTIIYYNAPTRAQKKLHIVWISMDKGLARKNCFNCTFKKPMSHSPLLCHL